MFGSSYENEAVIELTKEAFSSICRMKREENQVRMEKDNGNYYFIKFFSSNRKWNYIICDFLSYCLIHL